MIHTYMACLAMAGALLTCGAARAGIIEDFQFSDANGTLLGAAANSANPGNNWLVHASTVESAVLDGSFRVQKQSSTSQAGNSLDIANVTSGKVWLVARIAGWNYTETPSSPSERIRFGFLDNTDPVAAGASTITAEMTIDRSGDGLILSGEALGTGNTAVPNDYALPLSRTTPLTIVLELDKDADQYSVFYRDGGPLEYLGTGELGASTLNSGDRDGNSIRFAIAGQFGDTGEYFDIDRIYLSDMPIPEPSALALVAFAASIMICQRKRAAFVKCAR